MTGQSIPLEFQPIVTLYEELKTAENVVAYPVVEGKEEVSTETNLPTFEAPSLTNDTRLRQKHLYCIEEELTANKAQRSGLWSVLRLTLGNHVNYFNMLKLKRPRV